MGRDDVQHLCHVLSSRLGGLHLGYPVPLCGEEGCKAGGVQVSLLQLGLGLLASNAQQGQLLGTNLLQPHLKFLADLLIAFAELGFQVLIKHTACAYLHHKPQQKPTHIANTAPLLLSSSAKQ